MPMLTFSVFNLINYAYFYSFKMISNKIFLKLDFYYKPQQIGYFIQYKK